MGIWGILYTLPSYSVHGKSKQNATPGLPLRNPPCRIRTKAVMGGGSGERAGWRSDRGRADTVGTKLSWTLVPLLRTAQSGGQLCSGRRLQRRVTNPGRPAVRPCWSWDRSTPDFPVAHPSELPRLKLSRASQEKEVAVYATRKILPTPRGRRGVSARDNASGRRCEAA